MTDAKRSALTSLAVAAAICLLCIPVAVSAGTHAEYLPYRAGETELEGYLVYDNSIEGPRPAVLIVHEWWGRDSHVRQRADRLAKLGYIAFAVDMYGVGKLTDSVEQAAEWSSAVKGNPDVAIQRFKAAMAALKANADVDPNRIAAIGYCFGGTICLEMARAGVELGGVVSFHAGLKSMIPEEKRNISSRVLVCTGANDPHVPLEEVVAFEDEMRRTDADWQVMCFGGAQHSFTNPEADKHNITGVAYSKKADERSWEALKIFLLELFGE